MAFVAGPYTLALGGNSLGVIDDAIRMSISPSVDPITGDNLGDVIQDGVYRGFNITLDMVLNEYNAAGALAAFFPWNATIGRLDTPGKLLTDYDASLVLTKIAGTNAIYNTLTASQAVLAPNFNVDILFGTRLKQVPIRFQLLPYDSGGNNVLFTST